MIDNVLIFDKFEEFRTVYADERIDDFDTFLIARVADYFINTQGASTDEIYAIIKSVLFDSSQNTEDQLPLAPPVDKKDKACNDRNRNNRNYNNRNCNKPLLMGYVLIAAVALVSITLLKRLKNKEGI